MQGILRRRVIEAHLQTVNDQKKVPIAEKYNRVAKTCSVACVLMVKVRYRSLLKRAAALKKPIAASCNCN
jgi:hypothetical protein